MANRGRQRTPDPFELAYNNAGGQLGAGGLPSDLDPQMQSIFPFNNEMMGHVAAPNHGTPFQQMNSRNNAQNSQKTKFAPGPEAY